MSVPALADHALVGGTALALRYGHRLSVDLDLFGTGPFDHDRILQELRGEFGEDLRYEQTPAKRFGIFCSVAGIKVDVVRYPHPLLEPVVVEKGIRMYTDADIAAMKVQAILGRGRKKDFWDLWELLQHHSLGKIADQHRAKYPDQMLAISIASAVTYFADAEESEAPVSLKGQTWEEIKRSISKAVSDYLK